MNKIIIAIVVVAIVLAGGYFFFKGSYSLTTSVPQTPNQQIVPPSSVAQLPVAEEKVVVYTDSGYSPSSITIKKGETVIFKNQSSQSMWTASAMHPTHKLYPTTGGCLGSTFDACQGILPGNNWSFKFDIAGTWKYHNHLNPANYGAVIVE